ncbi:MAG: hypothetical protein ACD_2C00141G0021 [uncultured bacterium (gcode 4)]|uniref:Uncharacterized protein n=1 Tax=uncultured bacterium (gcode 4) TaxID=1234023 RepID=K2GGQ3_9BACT|nr:MAG: hypothetical protein ACD_2C00141G0021 [uncultured bacterium (gcode 4)]
MRNSPDKHLDSSLFDNFDIMEDGAPNETLIRAKTVFKTLADLIIEHNGSLGEPLIVWLQGMPWSWKSHLMDIMESIVKSQGIPSVNGKSDRFLISQGRLRYEAANIVFSDDLFHWANSLAEVDDMRSDKWYYDLKSMPEFLFHIYDSKKIWIVSSNFPIKEILRLIWKKDTIWRLNDRIEHLLASVQPIEIIRKESYRKKLAKDWTRLTSIFSKAVEDALIPNT